MSYFNKEQTINHIVIKYKIKQNTFSGWIKKKEEIIDQYEKSLNKKVKKNKKPQHIEVEKATNEWFAEVRRKNISVTGPILMQKAEQLSFCGFIR